jgi:hypothetical protein
MSSELTMAELDVVSGGRDGMGVVQTAFVGLVDGFEKAGGTVECTLSGLHDQCTFSSGGNTVTTTSPMF